jgi:geranylgeranyl diphosphate synthase type I
MTTSSPPVAAPPSLGDIAARVDDRIAQALDRDARRWAGVDADLAAPLAALRSLVLSGGKRLRPAFCYWAFVGMGGDPDDATVTDGGCALELLHTFALIHDDVMDASARRHGVETVHVSFARRHRQLHWHGDAARFGDGVAILVGDLAFVYADRFLAGAPRPALDVWNELRLEVNVGQYLDTNGTAARLADPDLARRICRYKSGKYTIERPLHLGAALAAPASIDEVIGALSAYGDPLGEAFQLKDDMLGVFGDPSVTGKPVGEDLREGKPTLLHALAARQASGSDRELLGRRFGSGDLTFDEVEQIQEIFRRTGASAAVADTIDRLVDRALAAAEGLPLRPEAVGALIELAHFVAGRDH